LRNFSGPFHELDTVAERVSEFEPVAPGNPNAIKGLDAVRTQELAPRLEVGNLIGDMSLRGLAVDRFRVGADVDLAIADLEPQTSPALEALGLLDFAEAKQLAVERTGPRFFAGWDRDLDEVDAPNRSLDSSVVRFTHQPLPSFTIAADDEPSASAMTSIGCFAMIPASP
jgi:hypothetical protein